MYTPNQGFADRTDAAEQLVDCLQAYRGCNPLVLAIPRGAVPMGKIIAERLGGELDIVLVRKLRAPGNLEYAIGAIDETGNTTMNMEVDASDIDANSLTAEQQYQKEVMRKRRSTYMRLRPAINVKGRIVLLLDDGIATGSTMIAALKAVRLQNPDTLICVTPVAPPESIKAVAPFADAVVCLLTAADFHAVSQFYRDFTAVDDTEVAAILQQSTRSAYNVQRDDPDLG
ncbi:MAG: phosphoribosyltransferase [Glaciimonas sp.]|nr:phosphoribosyltransferase [Glaciimonas sp.]